VKDGAASGTNSPHHHLKTLSSHPDLTAKAAQQPTKRNGGAPRRHGAPSSSNCKRGQHHKRHKAQATHTGRPAPLHNTTATHTACKPAAPHLRLLGPSGSGPGFSNARNAILHGLSALHATSSREGAVPHSPGCDLSSRLAPVGETARGTGSRHGG
jgi:hypothetical protein